MDYFVGMVLRADTAMKFQTAMRSLLIEMPKKHAFKISGKNPDNKCIARRSDNKYKYRQNPTLNLY